MRDKVGGGCYNCLLFLDQIALIKTMMEMAMRYFWNANSILYQYIVISSNSAHCCNQKILLIVVV